MHLKAKASRSRFQVVLSQSTRNLEARSLLVPLLLLLGIRSSGAAGEIGFGRFIRGELLHIGAGLARL